jgi:hypothetical protein
MTRIDDLLIKIKKELRDDTETFHFKSTSLL